MGIISNLLFGDNSNNVSYKDAAYKKRYQDISRDTFDSMYGGMTDYLDKNYEGGANKFKYDYMEGLKNDTNDAIKNYNQTKYNVFGSGLIGSLLNPIAQTAGAVSDLAGMALSGGKYNAWDSSKDPIGAHRDIGSDIGALGESLLTVIPIGKAASLAKAGKAVGAGTATAKQAAKVAASQAPKTLGQKVAGGALLGAGFGATGSLRDMGFENFNPSQFGLSTALGAGIGGGLSGLGHAWNKMTSAKVPVQTGDATPYQEALNNLKNNYRSPAMYSDTATNLPAVQGLDVSRVSLNNLDDETLSKLFRNSVKNARSNVIGQDTNALTSELTNNKNLLQKYLKNGVPTTTSYEAVKANSLGDALKNLKTNVGNTKAGTKISNLLKTKKGKIGLGIGGGLLLANLLGNKKNEQQMTDEELYNYIYGGGQ